MYVMYVVTLGGLVVSVLAIGPKGSNPAEDDGFLSMIKFQSMASSEGN
jgi:hypothetical protein